MIKNTNKKIIYIVPALALFVIVFLFFQKKPGPQRTPPSPVITLPAPPQDTMPMPVSAQWLADSIRVFLMKNSRLDEKDNFNVYRQLKLDGEAFFEAPAAIKSFTLHTKLLTLTINAGTAFRVIAPTKEEWAEIQILSGTIIAKKAYPSKFSEPDTLRGSQLLMINRTIDLMEKEKLDPVNIRILQNWRGSIRE